MSKKALLETVEHAEKGVLVAFYASWCGHCRKFVLEDDAGLPEKAPLELLNDELTSAGGPTVVKFDIDASDPPVGYEFVMVPTVYFADSWGSKEKYEGDPQDRVSLKAFALSHEKKSGLEKVGSKVAEGLFGFHNVTAGLRGSVKVAQAPPVGAVQHSASWAALGAVAGRLNGRPSMSALQLGAAPMEGEQISELQAPAASPAVARGSSPQGRRKSSDLVRLSMELDDHLIDRRLDTDPLTRLSESLEGDAGGAAALAQWVGGGTGLQQRATPAPEPTYLSDLD